MHDRVNVLVARLTAGDPFSETDALELAQATDILTLGMLADEARRRKHGADTTFVRVFDVALPVGGASIAAVPPAAGEVRVRGPLDDLDATLADVRRIVAAAGTVPVSAFSLTDLESCAVTRGHALDDVLRAVRHAGVSLIAEAPLDTLANPEAALDAVRAAGLDLARLTVHRPADAPTRVALIRRAAELQHALGWIRGFAPLPRTWDPAAPATGYEDARQVALARLLADNIPSIQVDWSLYGPKLAQVALTVGADDVDSVSASDASPDGRRRAPLEEITRNIQAAALVPVARDGAFRRIRE
ncbi:MAG: hypothetical protein NTY02_08685 [Acidobacteria bacterium]|nr:hypothetical protein [Acidobacteriota bacterium]